MSQLFSMAIYYEKYLIYTKLDFLEDENGIFKLLGVIFFWCKRAEEVFQPGYVEKYIR